MGAESGAVGDGRVVGAAGGRCALACTGSVGAGAEDPVDSLAGVDPGMPSLKAGAPGATPGPAGAASWWSDAVADAGSLSLRGAKERGAGRWAVVRGSVLARSAAAADVDRATAGRPLRTVATDAVGDGLGPERAALARALGVAGEGGAAKAASARMACCSASRPAGVASWWGAVPDFC